MTNSTPLSKSYFILAVGADQAIGRMSLSDGLGIVPKAFAASFATRAQAEALLNTLECADAIVQERSFRI